MRTWRWSIENIKTEKQRENRFLKINKASLSCGMISIVPQIIEVSEEKKKRMGLNYLKK